MDVPCGSRTQGDVPLPNRSSVFVSNDLKEEDPNRPDQKDLEEETKRPARLARSHAMSGL